jgi:hypothetical protein
MKHLYHLACLALASAALPAHAQSYEFTITPSGPTPSTMNATFSGSASFSGTFTGNYHQVNNPTGTRVLDFDLFSPRPPAPTNLVKNLSGTGGASGTAVGSPVGTYAIEVHDASVTLRGLSADLIGGAAQSPTPVNTTITYQSFRTASPNYDYPFLVPIPVPLGESSLTRLEVVQTTDATGQITGEVNGVFSFTVLVPVEVTAAVSLQGNDVTQVSEQTLEITGSITPGPTSAIATLSVALTVSDSSNTPAPQPTVPFALPPLTGSGDPANLLLTLTVNSQSTQVNGSAALHATGVLATPLCGTADFDGDGDSGTDADIEAFFACLAGSCCDTCYPGGADFNADGDSGTDADIESFFRVLAGGPC